MSDSATRREELVERFSDATLGALMLYTVYVGDELGFYVALSENDWLTPPELAERTGTYERYVREWLEQQAGIGILEVRDDSLRAPDREYRLPEEFHDVLVDRDSRSYMAQQAHLVVGGARPLDAVVEAFETGDGVPFDAYGPLREGQARTNRAEFRRNLGTEWLPSVPGLADELESEETSRIADVGCGAGWACVGMAEAYPNVRVDGFDLDEPSVERARRTVERLDLDERVTIHCRDATALDREDEYDLVTAFEVVHDLPNPVEVLAEMRKLVRPDGDVLLVDQRCADSFDTEMSRPEQMMYGWSVVHCLPVGMTGDPSAETGTVMRKGTLREYAEDAGFSDFEVLPIEHEGFRFYRLRS